MRSLICTQPHQLDYEERAMPERAAGQAIVRIKRIGICGTDLHAFEGTQPFFEYPRILGHELAGELIDAGEAQGFEKGEHVTFIPYFNCGDCIACRSGLPNCCTSIRVFGVHIHGGFSEFVSIPSYALVHGEGLSYDELALVEPLSIAAHGIRRAAVKPEEIVLVVGAGPIGLGLIEFANIAGARVVVMDINENRLSFVKKHLMVHGMINPSQGDVFEQLKELTNGDMAQVVIDATGSLKAIRDSFAYLSHGGRYVLVGLQKGEICFSHPEFHKREATLMSSRNATREDFNQVVQSMKKGLVKPATYITHRVSFSEVKSKFESWLDPANGVVKVMVELD